MDRTTEAICHFAGAFNLADEAAKLRLDLPEGPNPDAADAALPAIHTFATHFRFPHQPEGFVPALDYTASPFLLAVPVAADFAATLGAAVDRIAVFLPADEGGRFQDVDLTVSWQAPRGGEAGLAVPVPNSHAGVTIQIIRLSDDDIHLEGGWADFAAPAAAMSRLGDLAAAADAAHAFALPELSGQPAGWAEFAAAAKGAIAAGTTPPAAGGLDVATLRGDAASGTFVNGAAADEMPLWSDLRPAFLRRDDDADEAQEPPDETETGRAAAPAGRDRDDAGETVPASGLVTGGNEAVNQVASTSYWVDAPVISVMGDVWKIDAISQIAMLHDRDAGTDAGTDGPMDGAASRVTNAAEIGATSSNPDGAAAGQGLPAAWDVTRIEGDLISLNKVVQQIFATDNDRVEIVSGGRESFLSTGENVLTDAASFLTYGFHYDLIFVGGDMIDLSMIRQTNVLLDDDSVTGGAGGAGVSGGDNSLFNAASLTSTGIDTFAGMPEAFREAGAALAKGARDLSADLARDEMFSGMDALRALYIDGDFVKIDLVEQSVIFGDADQIATAIGAAAAEATEAAKTILGSNAQANIARLHDQGLDSTILAGGETYSDALIHQASLIDGDADPAGVMMQGLASEAVAFLVDGMIEPEAGGEHGGLAISDDGGAPLDIMQTMLA